MDKINLRVILIVMLLFLTPATTFAANKVSERPEIKVVIDGVQGTYSMPPIILNNRTMLPITEILNNLGVSKGNIKWNGKEQSVSVTKDATKLYLKVNSNKAYINNRTVALDAAPIIYKNRTYIPVSFVSQSLGKKVVWDASTNTIAICPESSFNQVKEIFTKSDSAMIRYKVLMSANMDINGMVEAKAQDTEEYDYTKKIKHSISKEDLNGEIIETETYLLDNIEYSKTDSAGNWIKKILTEEECKDVFSSNTEGNDALCAGLIIKNGENTDEIVLQGDVGIGNIIENAKDDTKYKANTKIVFDKNTYAVKEMQFNASGFTNINDSNMPYKFLGSASFTQLQDNYEITIPDEIKKLSETHGTPDLSALGIQIIQNGKVIDILKQEEDVTLNKGKFSIRFNMKKYDTANEKYYSAQIAALPDEKIFNQFEYNVSTNKSQIFEPGNGLAAYDNEAYPHMYIGDRGFHYIFYENENNRRADLISINDNDLVNAEWKIDKVYMKDTNSEYSVTDIPLDNLYLIIFIDNNLDDKIDADEFSKIHIIFK